MILNNFKIKNEIFGYVLGWSNHDSFNNGNDYG